MPRKKFCFQPVMGLPDFHWMSPTLGITKESGKFLLSTLFCILQPAHPLGSMACLSERKEVQLLEFCTSF